MTLVHGLSVEDSVSIRVFVVAIFALWIRSPYIKQKWPDDWDQWWLLVVAGFVAIAATRSGLFFGIPVVLAAVAVLLFRFRPRKKPPISPNVRRLRIRRANKRKAVLLHPVTTILPP